MHMMKMCQAMTRLGIKVECVLPGRFSKDALFEYYGVTTPFPITFIPFTNGVGRQIVHGFTSALLALIRKKQYDFVLTRNLVFAWMATGFLSIPVVYDAHHPPVNMVAQRMIKFFSRKKKLLGMSFNSEGLKELYGELGIKGKNFFVAHNGVDIEMFSRNADRPSLATRLGYPAGTKTVCYCGNTYKGRGIDVLVNAAERLCEVVFVVVGGREQDNVTYRLDAERRGIKNFIMVGFVDQKEVASYLLGSDVLVMPYSSAVTIKGGTQAGDFTSPLKLFEYMATGKPIVATAIPSVLEILESGKNSVTVSPNNSEEFFSALEFVLSEPEFCSKISSSALEDIKKYTWENRVRKIIKITQTSHPKKLY